MANDQTTEILLVEDNPNDVRLALHAFKSSRISNPVHVARDGAEALEYIFGEGEHSERSPNVPPRMILLDLKLPKVDGLEVLRRVKSDPRTRVIPVVVMTASKEENDIVESYNLGVNSYIVKPVDFDQFTKSIGEIGYYWLVINEPPVLSWEKNPDDER